MKPEMNKKYNTIAAYAFVVLAAVCLFSYLLFNLNLVFKAFSFCISLLMPFIIGFALAYLLNPLVEFFIKGFDRVFKKRPIKRNFKRGLAISLSFLIITVILIFLVAVLIPRLIESLSILFNSLPDYMQNIQNWLNNPTKNNWILSFLFENVSTKFLSYLGGFLESWGSLLKSSLPAVYSFLVNIGDGIKNFSLGLVISVYMLIDKNRLLRLFKKITYAILSLKAAKALIEWTRRSNEVFSGFLVGRIVDSLIVGVVCFVFMVIFKMPYAALISIIVGVTNIIPYFGSIIGSVVSALIILIINPITALWFLLFITVLQQIDGSFLSPKILGKTIGISAFWIMFAILFFGGLFGIMGMFIGVPLFAVIYFVLAGILDSTLKKKGIDIDKLED